LFSPFALNYTMKPTVEDEMDEDFDAEEENKLINEVSYV
jgi:hypothetical protein